LIKADLALEISKKKILDFKNNDLIIGRKKENQ